MPPEAERYFAIEMILGIEVVLIFSIVLAVCLLHIFSAHRLKKDQETDKALRALLLKAITESQLPQKGEIYPHLYSISIVVQVLRELNGKIKGANWRKIKELILKEWIGDQVYRALFSKGWKKKSWALQALALYPKKELEEKIITLLRDKVPAVRFSSATCIIHMKTQNGVNHLLQVMAKEETYARYPYRDLLVTGDSEIFTYVANQYRDSQDQNVRICALEVLSQKIGFIKVDLIKKDLDSDNPELKWWALRALENCPSEESMAILEKHAAKDQDERLRSIAIQSLGIIMDRKALSLFEKLLKDPSQVIRVQAAIALKKLGSVGLAVLKNQKEDQHKEAFDAARFALSLPDDSLDSQAVKWFRYY
ncbi:MAG: HEAT repeat domain-containing protein [Chlamydiales bacterium]|nr:HEAT repeat domain-containing protein [Chlamydiales bacterium]